MREAKINLSPKREDVKARTAKLAKKKGDCIESGFYVNMYRQKFQDEVYPICFMFIWFFDDVWYAPDHCHDISNQVLLRIKTAGMPSLHSLLKLKEALVKTFYKILQNKK